MNGVQPLAIPTRNAEANADQEFDFSLPSTPRTMPDALREELEPMVVRNPSELASSRAITAANELDFSLSNTCKTMERPVPLTIPAVSEEHALRLALMAQQQQPTLPLSGAAARAGLVEYISEVVQGFGLARSTVGLAVTYYDSFVARSSGHHDPQLLSLTCTRLAAKFSEVQLPACDDLCELARTGLDCVELTEAQVTAMEVELLRVLQWELNVVTAWTMLAQLEVLFRDEVEVCRQAELFVELSYYEPRMSGFAPLVVAAAAVLCACTHLGRNEQARLYLQQRLCEACAVRVGELTQCRLVLQGCLETAVVTTVVFLRPAGRPLYE